jgi:hypothetical protein
MQKLLLTTCGLAITSTVALVSLLGKQELLLELQPGSNLDPNQLVIRATNTTAQTMSIVGSQSSCSCGYVTGLPVSIRSGEVVDLGLVLSSNYFDAENPLKKMDITLFLDRGGIEKQKVVFEIGNFLDRHRSSVSK